MSENLVKLAVGIEDVGHLSEVQKRRLQEAQQAGGEALLRHFTRHQPRRAEALLDGGSIYWVIKRFIRVRQRILGLEQSRRPDGRPACAIILDSRLVRTEPRSFKAFQGWRYLRQKDVPADLEGDVSIPDELPEEMADELKDLGLL